MEKRLGEIANFINGHAFKPTDWEDEGLPIIRIQNLTDPSKPFNRSLKNVPDKYFVSNGDILISWSGTLGVYEWKGKLALLNQHIFKVELTDDNVDRQYFKYVVERSLKRLEEMLRGSTMKHVIKKDFDNLVVPIPDHETQRQIVAALDKAKALTERQERSATGLEQLLRSTFIDMFGDPITNPKNWRIEPLENICTKITDGAHQTPNYQEDGIKFISAKNLKNEKIDWTDVKFITQDEHMSINSRSDVEKGDILLSKSGSLGQAVIVNVDFQFSIYESLALIKYDREILTPFYLWACFNSEPIQFLLRKAHKGVAVKHIHLTNLKKIPIPIPPRKLLLQFEIIAGRINQIRKKLEQTSELANNLFQSLMQRAFHGDLIVDLDVQLDGLLESGNFQTIEQDRELIQTLVNRFNDDKLKSMGYDEIADIYRFKSEAEYNRAKDALFHLLKNEKVTQTAIEVKDEPYQTRLERSKT
ncbi:restriction endonuclease subunit S [bacterium]|nr:restriction endonuclease subunit S [bacterium]